MPTFTVTICDTVSTSDEFEADTYQDALETAYQTLDLTTCHQCPSTSGGPSFIVYDESDNEVYTDMPEAGTRKRLAVARKRIEELEAFVREASTKGFAHSPRHELYHLTTTARGLLGES